MSELAVMHGFLYSPVEDPQPITAPVSDDLNRMFDISYEEAEKALSKGNSPVGAMLVDFESGREWRDYSINDVSRKPWEHAEILNMMKASPVVLDRLGRCAAVSTLELCPMCTTMYAQTNVGNIFVAVSRNSLVREDGSPIIRKRSIGMHELLKDSAGPTSAYVGYRADESIELWRTWDRRRRA